MTNVTINDLTQLTPPMVGTELLEIERSGTSYKVMAGDLAVSPPAAALITTSAISQDLDPLQLYYEITTGGTAGDELLNLPNLPVDANFVNGAYAGRTLIVSIKTQTDPGDKVRIKVGGSGGTLYLFPANYTPLAYQAATPSDGALLDYAGSAIAFVWIYDSWRVTNQVTNQYDDTAANVTNVSLTGSTDLSVSGKATSSGVDGGALLLSGGDTFSASAGGAVTVRGGNNSGTGLPGAVTVKGGNGAASHPGADLTLEGGSGTSVGNVLMPTLPTADPNIAGALFTNGVPSAGVPKALMVSGG